MTSTPLLVGIDNGTQGTKVGVYRLEDGVLLTSASHSYGLEQNAAGRREQDARVWIEALKDCLARCLDRSALARHGVSARDVVAAGVSGQQHGCVALDAAGEVLRPVKLWCDTETTAEVAAIVAAAGGPNAVLRATGNSLAVGFTASKVRWIRDREPALYARLATVLLPHDYLNFWLTGERKTDFGDASGTGYFDVRARTWSKAMLDAVDPSGRLAGCLPEIVGPGEVLGTIRPEVADEFGLSHDVVVSCGGGDNMMAAIGTGNVAPGIVTASFGTSGTIFAYSAGPVVDPHGELAAFCSSSGGWLPLVCTMNVTVATERTRALFGMDLAAFSAAVESAPAGADGVVLVPYFNGERTPARPQATASFHGLTTANTTPANLCRAAMEGATFGLRYGLDVLRRSGVSPTEIRLVGGGAKSRVWRGIAAGVFGCPVVCPADTEAGARGAALQAALCWLSAVASRSTDFASLTRQFVALDESTRIVPDAAAVARYGELYADAYAPLATQ